MAAALTKYYSYTPYLLYDGTNGADIVATFNTNPWTGWTDGCVASLTSDNGTTTVIHFTNVNEGGPSSTRDVTMNIGDVILLTSDPNAIPASTQSLYFTAGPSVGGGSAGPASTVKYGGYGEAILGALTVGSTNIVVPIKPAQPDTGYVASAFLDGPTLALGTVSVGTPVNSAKTYVTVPVSNTGLLALTLSSGTVSVHITAPQA